MSSAPLTTVTTRLCEVAGRRGGGRKRREAGESAGRREKARGRRGDQAKGDLGSPGPMLPSASEIVMT